MEGYQCEKVLDKDGVKTCGFSTALRPKAYLAGRSGHEAQGSVMSLG
jgi:hypothetical protein